MRKAVIVLSLTTAAFAASTLYLARELQVERASAAVNAPAIAVPAPVHAPAPAPVEPATVARSDEPVVQLSATLERASSPAMSATVINAPRVPAELLAQMNAQQHKHHQELVQRFDDPEQRAEMLAEFKAMVRNNNQGLAQALKLSKEDGEKLIDLLTLQQVENQVGYARCSLDGSCDAGKIGQFGTDSATQEIANLLGPEGQQKLNQYRNSISERESVSQFRSRLSDATYLREDTAESLIAVLAEERMRISVEASKHGSGLTGIGNGMGMVWVSETNDSPEARYASAQENSRRLRARAAEVLTASQLRVFEEMQDELLLSTRQQLRQKQDFNANVVTITTTN
jgi:molybdopterin-guanine dinucleotide biosynthesis protein A